MRCPLGLPRRESNCPNAPCLECMRRLGDDMIEEIKVLERRSRRSGDATASLDALLTSLGISTTCKERAA